VEVTDDHLHIDDALAIDDGDHAEDAVCARVLRPDVDFDEV
jgi:hypothetical protein